MFDNHCHCNYQIDVIEISEAPQMFSKSFVCISLLFIVSETLIIIMYVAIIIATRFWKADQNVTLGLFCFIGPTNSHTHTLPVYCCITRLS